MADGGLSPHAVREYLAWSNTIVRLIGWLGLEAKQHSQSPTIHDLLARRARPPGERAAAGKLQNFFQRELQVLGKQALSSDLLSDKQIDKLTGLQADTAAYVAKTLALVALQPDHTGWTMPVLADQLNAQRVLPSSPSQGIPALR
jgi:hypothetical protein